MNTDDVEHVEGGKTFFYACECEWNLNVRHTLDTQLNVFGDFEPKLSGLQGRRHPLPRQHPARPAARGARAVHRRKPVGLDSDELLDRERARVAGAHDRDGRTWCSMNDDEVRMLTEEPTLEGRAPADGARPERRRGQAGRVRRGAVHRADGFFSLPAYPLETVIDPPARATRSPAACSATSTPRAAPTDDATLRPRDDLRLGRRVATGSRSSAASAPRRLTRRRSTSATRRFAREMTFIAADACEKGGRRPPSRMQRAVSPRTSG